MRRSPGRSKTPIIKIKREKEKVQEKSAQIMKIIEIKERFQRSIKEPIKRVQQIRSSQTPQRCLIHNTIYTLYCQFDRKPICACCMYQQQTHRRHKVIPISKATNLIKEDVFAFQIKLQSNLEQCRAISRKLQQVIIRNQKFYPAAMDQLKKFYKGIIKMLNEKQKQQLEQIKQLQNKMQKQVILLQNQVKNIATFMIQKLCPVKITQTEEVLLTRRNVFEILIKVNKVINGQLNQIFPQDEQNKNLIDFNLFNDVHEMTRSKLMITIPKMLDSTKNRMFSSSKSVEKISPKNLMVNHVDQTKKAKKSFFKEQISSTNLNYKQPKQVKFKFQ